MKIKRLREVAAAILAKPKQLDMDAFFGSTRGADVYFAQATNGKNPAQHCGTTACIAGWACALNATEARKLALNGYDKASENYALETANDAIIGRTLLGLNEEEETRLFYRDRWPSMFDDMYTEARSPQERALVTAARIERFIATGGVE